MQYPVEMSCPEQKPTMLRHVPLLSTVSGAVQVCAAWTGQSEADISKAADWKSPAEQFADAAAVTDCAVRRIIEG